MSDEQNKRSYNAKELLNPIILLTVDDFIVSLDRSKLDEKREFIFHDPATLDVFTTRGVSYFEVAHLFFSRIIEEINNKNSFVTEGQSAGLKPLFFICREYLFWATIDVDSRSGKFLTNSLKIYSPYEACVYRENKSGEYDYQHPIYPSLLARQTFANYTGRDKTAGYELIEITESDLNNTINPYSIHGGTFCRWCGSIIDNSNDKTKHNEYCLGTIDKNGRRLPSPCKIRADTFQRQLKPLLDEWIEYRECLASGDEDTASIIKTHSKYAYLLDDSARFYFVTKPPYDVYLNVIRDVVRPLINYETLQPVNFDANEYRMGHIGPGCPVCGNPFSQNMNIHSRYCSGKCRAKAHNDMNKSKNNITTNQ